MGVSLTGTLTCSGQDIETVRAALPRHIELSRAEPGCLRFDVTETKPGVFSVSEEFIDQAAFDAHQTRTWASEWWSLTSHIPRDFKVSTS